MASHSKSVLTDEELKARYAWSLDRKIEESCDRIVDWHSRFGGRVSVSFSGGLDSTVLLDLVRNKCGYPDVPAVFSNTGLEFPENVHFVRSIPNVHEIRPRRGFRQVIETFGYPVVSKRVSQYVGEVQRAQGETATKRLRLTGMTSRGTKSRLGEIPDVWKPLVTCGFRVSDKCCDVLKKEPLARAMKLFGPPFVGTRAEESMQRELSYKQHGCNAYHMQSPRSTPIAFWTGQDIREYIQRESLPYSPLYDMGYDRSGCMWCLLGAHHADDNRFELLAKTHPRVYAFCRDRLGLFDVLRVVQTLWNDRYRRKKVPLLPLPSLLPTNPALAGFRISEGEKGG